MPTYRFKNEETGEIFEKWMLMAEREPFLSENPNIKQLITPPNVVDGDNFGEGWRGKLKKQHPDWKDVIGRVKNVAGSTTDISKYT